VRKSTQRVYTSRLVLRTNVTKSHLSCDRRRVTEAISLHTDAFVWSSPW